ncbi:LrgB family protein [Labrys monachus]|uniref:Effector of murein hydrolase n=1 Tax=Labrys monachus TaxID=217067 RepID=A0ABU0FCU8_9HYPH|nr:LrgB family protein [Labrys monachus]MDQ0392361.1 putative effector of murein hydrolase [Labrys monachus]
MIHSAAPSSTDISSASPVASPLFWLAVTLAAYLGAQRLQRLCRGSPLANPVLVAILIVAAVLLGTGTPYATYFDQTRPITFLLGPATVALAVPLARNLHHVRSSLRGIVLAVAAGSVASLATGIVLVQLFGGSRAVALSMAPKAATTPIAMAVSQEIGGIPALTAALAIVGGIVAAIVGQRLLGCLRISDWRVHGLAAGVAGSGVAAAHVAGMDGLAAAFAALGIALNGVITTLVAPLVPLLWP